MNQIENYPGVYEVVNRLTGDRYIGSTARSFAKRFSGHRTALRYGRGVKALQAQWDEYGPDVFDFRPLSACSPKMVREYEARAIKIFQPTLNSTTHCNSLLAHNHDTKAKMAKAKQGRVASDETRKKMSRSQRARGKRSSDVVEHMTESRRRRVKSYEVRGESLTAAEIHEKYGVRYDVLYARLKLGWDLERAATTPPNPLGTNQYNAAT